MTPHVVFKIDDPSRVGEARRHAAGLAGSAGFDAVAAGRLALVVTELGTNLLRHARGGRLLLAELPHEAGAIEVLSIDDGPGMSDFSRCLSDGFSSGGTPGTGLGAIQRLSNQFDAFSHPAHGTLIRAAVQGDGAGNPPSRSDKPAAGQTFVVGAVCTAAPGETVSGDGWSRAEAENRIAIVVADGLGHGVDAAAASDEALRVFHQQPSAAPSDVLNSSHESLRRLRGAAVAIAHLDATARTVTFCGAGNIAGRIISGLHDRSLLSQHGTIGLQIRRLQDIEYPWPEHALLVMHSDGINTRWDITTVPGLLQCAPSLIAAWLWRSHCRGRDDATAVVVRLQ